MWTEERGWSVTKRGEQRVAGGSELLSCWKGGVPKNLQREGEYKPLPLK